MPRANPSPPRYVVRPVGVVESPLTNRADAPLQGDEGAPDAVLTIDATVRDAVRGLHAGDDVLVLTWLDRADRDTLEVRPRDDPSQPAAGVFSTRSAERPNPIGLHRVRILAIDGVRIRVRNLEALDGTPIVDIKPILGTVDER